MQKRALIHPFLFSTYPVLLLFARNIRHVSLPEIIIPLGVVVGFSSLLFVVLIWTLGNAVKAGILVSIFLMFFFSYRYLYDGLDMLIPVNDLYFLPILYLLFFLAVYSVLKTNRDLHTLTNFLNVVIMTMVLITLVNVGSYLINSGTTSAQDVSELPSSTLGEESTSRDIYYIILERYGSGETLESVYDFNNEEFLNYLSKNGFYVATKSRVNYPKTAHSLASSLNLEYINYMKDEVKQPDDWKPILNKLEDYKVWRFLKDKGYDFVHLGGWWEPTRTNEFADVSMSFGAIPEFSDVLAVTTIIHPVISWLNIPPFGRKTRCKNSRKRFDTLSRIPEMEGPTFTFAHMFVTHEPFKFDENGQCLSEKQLSSNTANENYVNQVIFANRKVEQLIDELLAQYNSENLPIVIIQADEGPFPERYRENEDNFDWKNEATDQELRQKMRILNAYHLPDVDKSVLYPTITPVNTFRLIFNQYFETDLSLLPDRSYAFPDNSKLYDFFEITDIVDYQ